MKRCDHQHLDNDGHHGHDANDDNHGNNNGDQQMNIVGQFSHSQVEEEDCSGVAADSGAVCGDFHFVPLFSQFVHIFLLLRSMKTALRLFVTLLRLKSATQSEFQHKYKNCKHKVSKNTNTKTENRYILQILSV